MDLAEAKEYLAPATRWELRDHAFGDVEFGWNFDGQGVAHGYLGGGDIEVHVIISTPLSEDSLDPWDMVEFKGNDARELRKIGFTGLVERNDETGPDQFQEGFTMPGLTLGGVWDELTR